MLQHVLNFSSRLLVFALAASPLFLFQNCSQNFDLASVGDATSLGDQFMQPSSFVLDRGTGYSSRLLLPVHLNSPDAREVMITQNPNCVPAAGETWQSMAATQVYPLPQPNRSYRIFVKFRTLPGDLGKAVSLETSCVGADIVHDGKPPLVNIQKSGPLATAELSVPIDIEASDEHDVERLQCTLFNAGQLAGRLVNCARRFTLEPLALGENRLEVIAIDRAGNESTVDTHKIFVDQVKPTVAILSPASGASLSTASVNFTFTADDNYLPASAVRECRIDSSSGSVVQSWVACSSAGQHSSPTLSNGNYRFSVRAIDTVGNVSDIASRDFTVSAVAGAFVVSGVKDKSGSDGVVDEWLAGDRKPHVVWGLSSDAVQYEVSIIDASGNVACPAQSVTALSYAFDCQLTDGAVYGAKVRSFSATAQATDAPVFTFTVDATGTPASLAAFSQSHAKVELRAQADGAVTSFACYHRFTPEAGAAYDLGVTDCRSTVVFQGGDHRAGRHDIRVVTKDPAGNSRSTVVKSYTVYATDCSKIPGALTACPLVHDRFEREAVASGVVVDANDLIPWLKFMDTGLNSNSAYGGIYKADKFGAWPAASSAEGLVMAGAAGKDVVLITRAYDLSSYSRRVVKFDYATISLAAGEDVRLEYCVGSPQECGVNGAGDTAALMDAARWRSLATLTKSPDSGLTGVGVPLSQWLSAEYDIPANSIPGETYVRLRYKFSQGFATDGNTLLDGVMVDNFKILVDR